MCSSLLTLKDLVVEPLEQVATVPKLRQYISLPFYGPSSYKVRSEIQTMLKGAIPNVDFRIILKNSYTIGSFFQSKREYHVICCVFAWCICNYQCSGCNSRYIGFTTRSL